MSTPWKYELLGWGFVLITALYLYPLPIWKGAVVILSTFLVWRCWNVEE